MESKVNYTLVGLFSIFFLSCFFVAIFWFGKFGIKDDFDRYRVLATDSVSGLNIEAPVKYRGVVVGSVSSMRINPENTELIELTLKIKKDTPIKTSSVAFLRPQGITGLSFVDITPGNNNSPLLRAAMDSQIPTIAYGQSIFSKVDASFTGVVNKIQNILDKVDAAMSEKNMAHLSEILQNLSSVSAKMSARLDEIGEITKNSRELPAETVQAVKKISLAAESINSMAAKIDSAIKRGDFDYKKDVVKVTAETTKLLENLRELSTQSNILVKEIQKNPSSVLFESSSVPKGPGE